jgi:hypothetical protein
MIASPGAARHTGIPDAARWEYVNVSARADRALAHLRECGRISHLRADEARRPEVDISNPELRRLVVFTVLAVLVVGAFSVWAAVDKDALQVACYEDYPVEYLTALFFLLSSGGFVVFAVRSRFLRERGSAWVYAFPIAWALLMLFFAGEEISWGQRILGFETPEWVAEDNLQDEFNLHNYGPLDVIGGGKYRYLSIMMLLTGLLIPLFARTKPGAKLVRFFAYPVCPLAYWAFFVGAYVFGKLWDPALENDAAEVREFVMSIGMLLFGLHAARRPEDMYPPWPRLTSAKPAPATRS